MKELKEIVYKVSLDLVKGSTNLLVNTIQFDSRKIEQNDVFVAINGSLSNGHHYIEKAILKGAICIVCEELPNILIDNITYLVVQNSNRALAQMSTNFYDNPSTKLNLIGVTGTNGKTTITSLLFQLFKNLGFKVGLISTVKYVVHDIEYPSSHTTPDSLTLNKLLNDMCNEGIEYCFMEVSSHGIHQSRTHALNFKGGIFTNLSHDHLDYHNSFKEYRDVKKVFFDQLPKDAFALTNEDDKNGSFMLQNTKAKKFGYTLKRVSDFKAVILEQQLSGTLVKLNDHEVWSKLIGEFNAYNILAVFGVAKILEIDTLEILQNISVLESVDGRFQYTISPNKIIAIVDYAHTPDALENVLQTIQKIRSNNEKLITVFGCGGDRDKTKRPIMGKIASTYSNQIIITNDNPRTENANEIIDQIEKGVEPQNYSRMLSISDRKQAIKTAVRLAKPNDIILIAGKGHENYQEINGVRTEFDDFKIVSEMFNELKTN